MAVTQAQVAQLYVALFNRAAEGEGLRNWMADGANKTVAQLADSMLQAPAVRTYFNGSIDNDKDYIETIYKNILGKDYSQDPNGIDSWVKHLQAGHTRGETLVKLFEVAQSDIARAADPVAAQTFANKTAISEYVSQRIGNVSQDEEGNYNYTLFKQIISDTNATNLAHQKRLVDDAVKINFTTNDDNLVGNSSDNIYETVVSGFMGTNTFQPNDKLDAGRGNDTLKVSLDTNFTGLTTGYVKNVENLELTNTSNAVRYFNMNNIENIKNIVMIGNYATRLTNESNIATLTASDVKQGEIAIVYNPATVSGSNDTQELFLENVGNKTDDLVSNPNYNYHKNHVGVKFDGIETLNITTKTQASYIKDVDNKNVNITGAVSLDVKTTENVENIDASTFAGNLTADVTASTAIKTIKGGSGKDTFKFASVAGANPNLTIDGGANEDTVEFTNLNGSRRLNANNVENVTFVKNNDGTLDLANAQSIKSVTATRKNNTVSVTNSGIETLTIDTDTDGAYKINVTTATLKTINFTDRDLDSYTSDTPAAYREIIANNATELTFNMDKYARVKDGGTGDLLESSSVKKISFNIAKSDDELKYTVDSYRLQNTVSLETINYINEGKDFTLNLKDATIDAAKLATLNVKTANKFNIKDLATSSDANLKVISEINLQGVIKSDGTIDSEVILGNLGHASSLHGINLTAKDLKALTVGTVTTNTQINARFNVNLENIKEDVTFGNVKSGNTVVIAKNLGKDFTFGNLNADTIATNSTDNVRFVFDKVKGDVTFGDITNLSSLDGDFRNIDKTLTIGNITNSKDNSAIALNLDNIKKDVNLGSMQSTKLDITAKGLSKDFTLGNLDVMATATSTATHNANISFDGVAGNIQLANVEKFNNVKFDAKNVEGTFTVGNFTNMMEKATANFNFNNMSQLVKLGNFNGTATTDSSGVKYNLTADNLAQGLTIGNIGIKESDLTDIKNGLVNIDSGRTEGTVTIGDVTVGADSTVKIDLSQSLQANTVGTITGGNVTFKSSAISHTNGSSGVDISLASTTGINVDPKANVTGSVGQDVFNFKFRDEGSNTFSGKTYAVGGDLGDGMDKYTLDLNVTANNLKTIDLSALKNAEKGTITLGGSSIAINNKSLTVKGTDGDDTFNVDGALTDPTSVNKPNVLTLEGGRGSDIYNIGAAAKTNTDASKYVSISNIKHGDKVKIDGATSWAKYDASDLDTKDSLKEAANEVLAHSGANVANKIWAFTYKSDTYLLQDGTGTGSTIAASDHLVKLAGYHIDNLNPYFSGGELTL